MGKATWAFRNPISLVSSQSSVTLFLRAMAWAPVELSEAVEAASLDVLFTGRRVVVSLSNFSIGNCYLGNLSEPSMENAQNRESSLVESQMSSLNERPEARALREAWEKIVNKKAARASQLVAPPTSNGHGEMMSIQNEPENSLSQIIPPDSRQWHSWLS
ncbi:hypothetical protein H6P81_005758 [Aristolochia fimbriata]|uniref:Uncharacterized protein n=1 Tax=Aristolochia fimbriata TaxID=158543 RepID=A0AAV7EWI6_ARIFI|nr:hypothetical protein H6P81_005758 [Aristolochia fimbriata]